MKKKISQHLGWLVARPWQSNLRQSTYKEEKIYHGLQFQSMVTWQYHGGYKQRKLLMREGSKGWGREGRGSRDEKLRPESQYSL